jgi:glycosyltransferase 2 family protein
LKRGIIQILKFLAFFIVGLLLLVLAFRNIDFTKLGKGLREANYFWLLLSILFATFAYISRARRWNLLIHPLGFRPSFKNSFYSMMTGYLANMALPRIGEISKCVALGKKENIPVDQLIGTVVIERTIDFLSLLVIMFVMIFVDGGILGPFLIDNIYLPLQQKLPSMFGSALIFWILLVLSGFVILLILYLLRKKLRKIRFFAKLIDIAKGIIHGLKTVANIQRKGEFIFHTIFIWVNYILMTWVVVFAVKSTSHLDLFDGIFLLVIGGLAMSAPVQSGIGAFHLIISGGLFVVYGISREDGMVYAILAHESQLIFGAILGIFSFYALFRKNPSVALKDPLAPQNEFPSSAKNPPSSQKGPSAAVMTPPAPLKGG